ACACLRGHAGALHHDQAWFRRYADDRSVRQRRPALEFARSRRRGYGTCRAPRRPRRLCAVVLAADHDGHSVSALVRVPAAEDLKPVSAKIAITGAAGLVGQNLIPRLKARGYRDIVAIDKHPANTALLRRLHPDVTVIEADLAEEGAWRNAIAAADVIVTCHAQLGGTAPARPA